MALNITNHKINHQLHRTSPPETPTNPLSSFISLLYSGVGEDNRDPQQHSHTLGLDCYVHPCNGVCIFRPPSESLASPAESEPARNSCRHLVNNYCYRCIRYSDPEIETSNPRLTTQFEYASGQQYQIYSMNNRPANRCNLIVFKSGGQLQTCGKVYRTARALSEHKKGIHSKQQTCEVIVVGEHGQQRSCGMVCKNPKDFWDHKRRIHTGEQTCNSMVVAKDGQRRRCGKVYRNLKSLSEHKSRYHRKRKPVDLEQHDDHSPSKGKVSNDI